jgi:cell division protein FtsW (lipid II flippase)
VEAPQLTLSPRNRELAFLIVVGLLTAIGFASVYIARQSVVSTASLTYAGIFFGVFLAAHFVARATVPFADPYLLPIAAVLSALGLTEIYRLSPDDAFAQGRWIIIGVALFAGVLLVLRYDYRRLETYKYIFGLTAIGLLVLPILPVVGQTVNGARLWIHVGPLQFQPGELAKIMLIVFLAGYLREKREVLAQGRLKDFGPLLVIWGIAMLVLLETRDLGGGLLYFGIFLAMLFVATGRIAYVAIGLVLFVAGAVGVWNVTPHVQERVTVWQHPWSDHPVYCPLSGHAALRQNCQGYQIVQSLYSIAHGGYTGTGLGRGTVVALGAPGRPLIPYAKTDFIYSVIAQEIGLVGTAAFLLVYMVFVLRGVRIALLAQDGFSKLLAIGLTFAFALQVFIIVGGILRIIPLTGITLPLVSYGGSSVVANFILLAGLLLVSNRANREVLQ